MRDNLDVVLTELTELTPRSGWGDYILSRELTDPELSRLSDMLTSRAVGFAELASYLDARGGDGCGDHGEEVAFKRAATTRTRVRKALGYSYP